MPREPPPASLRASSGGRAVEVLGRALMLLGACLLGVGLLLLFAPKLPLLGKLPGDLTFDRGGVRFHLPLASSLLVSLVLSLVLTLLSKLR